MFKRGTLSFYIVYKSNQIGHLENSVLLVTSLPNLFLHVIFSNLIMCFLLFKTEITCSLDNLS